MKKRNFLPLFHIIFLSCSLTISGKTLSEARADGPDFRDHLAGVGNNDPRQRVDVRQMPWAAIGRVQTEQGSRCTGFLISPTVVETAAHCLWNSATHRFVPASIVHFLLAYSAGQYAAHARVKEYIIPPGYTPLQEEQKAGLDKATLLLDHPIARPETIFHVDATQNDIKAGNPVVLGGYEQNKPDVITADVNCQITGISRDLSGHPLLAHNCAGTHGSSGAPLLTNTRDGWQVLGIQTLAHGNEAGGFAVSLLKAPDTSSQP
ncbi:trypsin-like serine peptidase [Acetobacter thailandicus]|uniref:trypsin-like serine peptidase n=1 Tax=Acetobacter thailandicus TaxID=1502842 RepID=UPI0020126150|nr:trypsin-like serine protease [Acetobacter thailandicus]